MKTHDLHNSHQNIALRAVMERLGYAYPRVAAMLNRPAKTVYHWVRGAAKPTPEAVLFLEVLEQNPGLRAQFERRYPGDPIRGFVSPLDTHKVAVGTTDKPAFPVRLTVGPLDNSDGFYVDLTVERVNILINELTRLVHGASNEESPDHKG